MKYREKTRIKGALRHRPPLHAAAPSCQLAGTAQLPAGHVVFHRRPPRVVHRPPAPKNGPFETRDRRTGHANSRGVWVNQGRACLQGGGRGPNEDFCRREGVEKVA